MGLTRIQAFQISDIDYKQAVRVITTSNITLSGGAPSTVDGVTLLAGDRILVAGQNTGSQNGLYKVLTLGTGSNGTWVRTLDGDTTGEIEAGMIVMVTEGNVYKDTQWKLTTDNPIVIGVTALTFEQNSAFAFGNVYANGTAVLATTVGDTLTLTAGNNIAITGNAAAKSVNIAVTGISLSSIANGTSNVNIATSGGNVTVGVGGTNNIAVFSTSGANVTGYVTASGNVTGANLVTAGITQTGTLNATGNANVGNLGTTAMIATGAISGSTTLSITGNSNVGNLGTAGQVTATGNVTGGNLTTAGQVLATGNITGGNLLINNNAVITGNLTVNGTETIFNVQTLSVNDKDIVVANNVTGGANVNGAGIQAGNPAVATWLFNNATTSWQSNIGITPTSNGTLNLGGTSNYWNVIYGSSLVITGNANLGNIGGTRAVFTNLVGTLETAAQPNITSVGNLTSLTVTGNANVGNLGATNANVTSITATGNANVGNLGTAGQIIATGNITGGNFNLSGNIVDTGALFLVTGASGNVTLAPNGTNVIVATTTGANITGTLNATGNANVGNLGATNANLTALTVTGNANVGNLGATNANVTSITATGNANVGNLGTAGQIIATGNITGGNLVTTGVVSATGNITGNYILGNGSQLTGINTFSTIAVSGQSNVVADSIADTLTLAAGSGIAITTSAGNDTITISSAATDSIFATGGDMGTVVEPVTSSEDLGTVTSIVTISYDLGTESTGGIITPSLLLLPSYTVAGLGSLSANPAGQFVYCSNESGGAVPAFSDGTNWRRVTDRAIVT